MKYLYGQQNITKEGKNNILYASVNLYYDNNNK